MLRIQKSCTTRSTDLLLVFHWHIFLHPSQEPRAARQREGRKLQNFPSPAGKTVSKSHRGWRLLSLHTFRSSEEEGCFLEGKGGTPQGPGLLGVLFPLAATVGDGFNMVVWSRASLQRGTMEAQRVRYSALSGAWFSDSPTAVISTSPRLSITTQTRLAHPSKARQGAGWKNLYLHTKFCFCSCLSCKLPVENLTV